MYIGEKKVHTLESCPIPLSFLKNENGLFTTIVLANSQVNLTTTLEAKCTYTFTSWNGLFNR